MSGLTATDGLLEREYECDELARALAAASAGDGAVVALEGEAGIGKSALLAYATRSATEAGLRVLTARGGELEQDFGYGVVRQLFDAPIAAMTTAQRRRLLSGAAVFAAPALSTVEGAVAGAGAAESGSVLHGLYWLTANLAADGPLVIAIDDAHWGDSASIAFLNYLARRVDGLALFVLYASRIGEGAGDALPAFADAGFGGTALRPGVLGEQATIELIERSLAGESCREFAQACRAATAGNPFLLQELLRALHADGIAPTKQSCARVAQIAPGTISRAILARLRRLGTPATELAFAIAVLGRSAELRHAAALAALDPEAAGRAADALTSAAIVGDRRPLEFIHPIVRTTIYAEIPAARRAALHKRAAAAARARRGRAGGAGAASHGERARRRPARRAWAARRRRRGPRSRRARGRVRVSAPRARRAAIGRGARRAALRAGLGGAAGGIPGAPSLTCAGRSRATCHARCGSPRRSSSWRRSPCTVSATRAPSCSTTWSPRSRPTAIPSWPCRSTGWSPAPRISTARRPRWCAPASGATAGCAGTRSASSCCFRRWRSRRATARRRPRPRSSWRSVR